MFLTAGASIADSAKECTHVVFDNVWLANEDPDSVLDVPNNAHRVKVEWFWLSIQLNVCANEEMYRVTDKAKAPKSLIVTPLSPNNHLNVPQKSRRSSFFNRRHEIGGDNRFSMSAGSFFDASGDASSILADHILTTEDVENFLRTPKRCMSKRQQTCLELLQTENNYFQVLKTIVKLFKEPLERPDLIGGEILDITESRLIFGHIPPIFEVHSKINSDLASLIMHWNENRCIGDVFVSHKEDLLKSYPPFVNFFEKTKATLLECDKMKPRFHAFLKVCQSKPECQRQSLQELLIRPVQRLPSVILLLNDILKHTDKLNPDHSSLQQAIEALKGVLTHINDDKRKTEGQPYLLSSQRLFVSSAEVVELSDGFKRKGANLTFYVFNDCLEIAEKRLSSSRQDSYSKKHAELLFLSHIRRIVNIKGHADSDTLFCLTIRDDIEGDKNYPFQFLSSNTRDNKARFLNIIRNQVVTVTGRIGFEVQEYDVSCKYNETDLSRTIFKAVNTIKVVPMSSKVTHMLINVHHKPLVLLLLLDAFLCRTTTLAVFPAIENDPKEFAELGTPVKMRLELDKEI
uniref:DH domain-containing protein n=1 Tax=Romanomermis culicivorax TaxID=13658 RepID=A0A915J2I7_ROMCU